MNKIYLQSWLAPVARTSRALADPGRSSRTRAGRRRAWLHARSSSRRPRRTWMTAGTPSRRRRRWRASSRLALTRGLFSRTLLYSVAARPYVCTHTWHALWSTCTQVKPAVPTSGITYPRNRVAWSIARAYLHTFHYGHTIPPAKKYEKYQTRMRKSCSSIDEPRKRPFYSPSSLNVLLYRLLGGVKEEEKEEEEGKSSWTRFTATTTTITSTTPPHHGFMGIEAHCFLIRFFSTSSYFLLA